MYIRCIKWWFDTTMYMFILDQAIKSRINIDIVWPISVVSFYHEVCL